MLVSASKMSASRGTRHKHDAERRLHSCNAIRRFEIYTPGKDVSITTNATNHEIIDRTKKDK